MSHREPPFWLERIGWGIAGRQVALQGRQSIVQVAEFVDPTREFTALISDERP